MGENRNDSNVVCDADFLIQETVSKISPIREIRMGKEVEEGFLFSVRRLAVTEHVASFFNRTEPSFHEEIFRPERNLLALRVTVHEVSKNGTEQYVQVFVRTNFPLGRLQDGRIGKRVVNEAESGVEKTPGLEEMRISMQDGDSPESGGITAQDGFYVRSRNQRFQSPGLGFPRYRTQRDRKSGKNAVGVFHVPDGSGIVLERVFGRKIDDVMGNSELLAVFDSEFVIFFEHFLHGGNRPHLLSELDGRIQNDGRIESAGKKHREFLVIRKSLDDLLEFFFVRPIDVVAPMGSEVYGEFLRRAHEFDPANLGYAESGNASERNRNDRFEQRPVGRSGLKGKTVIKSLSVDGKFLSGKPQEFDDGRLEIGNEERLGIEIVVCRGYPHLVPSYRNLPRLPAYGDRGVSERRRVSVKRCPLVHGRFQNKGVRTVRNHSGTSENFNRAFRKGRAESEFGNLRKMTTPFRSDFLGKSVLGVRVKKSSHGFRLLEIVVSSRSRNVGEIVSVYGIREIFEYHELSAERGPGRYAFVVLHVRGNRPLLRIVEVNAHVVTSEDYGFFVQKRRLGEYSSARPIGEKRFSSLRVEMAERTVRASEEYPAPMVRRSGIDDVGRFDFPEYGTVIDPHAPKISVVTSETDGTRLRNVTETGFDRRPEIQTPKFFSIRRKTDELAPVGSADDPIARNRNGGRMDEIPYGEMPNGISIRVDSGDRPGVFPVIFQTDVKRPFVGIERRGRTYPIGELGRETDGAIRFRKAVQTSVVRSENHAFRRFDQRRKHSFPRRKIRNFERPKKGSRRHVHTFHLPVFA